MKKCLPTLVFLFALSACRTYVPSSVTRQNLADYYQMSSTKLLKPDYAVFNITDSMSRLYLSVNSSDLLYSKTANDIDFTAHMLISYIVHPVNFPKVMVDSGRVVLNDIGQSADKVLLSSIDMDIYPQDHFYMEVVFRDLNRNAVSSELLYFEHNGRNAWNNFLLTSPKVESPLFRTNVKVNEQFSIRSNNTLGKSLTVSYYRNNTGAATPPYSFAKIPAVTTPDSTWQILNDATQTLSFDKEGWYQVKDANGLGNGFTISVFNDGFPEINSAEQLVYPLRYLTTKQEYAAMDTAADQKAAVDDFWLTCCSSQERARTVIRYYYNRVAAANKLFSTEREGWKTDRGMIYLIFGPPSTVYKNASEETWLYGSDLGAGNITFIFDRSTVNTFSNNDFVLERNESFNVIWIQAVDSWRQGHAYNIQ